ncbi:SURF1 family protein [Corynebacterium phocae]|nr:SURF1 family protein [Corynebacterium phocae]
MAIFVVVFSYFAFTLLAPWQLGKDHDIVERNKAIEAAYNAGPVPLDEAVGPDGAAISEWTRVALHGRYLPDSEVLLRLRPVASGPTYQSLVPFKDDSGTIMLVNRGWVPAAAGNAVPEIPPAPSGEVTVEAMLRTHEGPHPSSKPIVEDGYDQVYTINPPQVGEVTGLDLGADYLQISDSDQPGVLNFIPVPQLERGSHLSYGFQWIAFGIMAPLGLGYFAWAEVRERRRFREEEKLLNRAAPEATPQPQPQAGPQVEPKATPQPQPQVEPKAAPQPQPQPAPKATPEAGPKPQPTSVPGPGSDAPSSPKPSSRRHRARYGDAKPDFYDKLNRRGKERF